MTDIFNEARFICKKISGVRGFVGITYAVFTEDGKCVKIFLSKDEAEEFINREQCNQCAERHAERHTTTS